MQEFPVGLDVGSSTVSDSFLFQQLHIRNQQLQKLAADDNSDRVGYAFPESPERPPDRASLTDQSPPSGRNWVPNLEAGAIPPLLRNPLLKQKSTPTLGVGHPPSLLKSALKSKSTANLQKDGNGSLPPRSTSAAGSYLTVESFQTAHENGDESIPSQSLGPLPQITVQVRRIIRVWLIWPRGATARRSSSMEKKAMRGINHTLKNGTRG